MGAAAAPAVAVAVPAPAVVVDAVVAAAVAAPVVPPAVVAVPVPPVATPAVPAPPVLAPTVVVPGMVVTETLLASIHAPAVIAGAVVDRPVLLLRRSGRGGHRDHPDQERPGQQGRGESLEHGASPPPIRDGRRTL